MSKFVGSHPTSRAILRIDVSWDGQTPALSDQLDQVEHRPLGSPFAIPGILDIGFANKPPQIFNRIRSEDGEQMTIVRTEFDAREDDKTSSCGRVEKRLDVIHGVVISDRKYAHPALESLADVLVWRIPDVRAIGATMDVEIAANETGTARQRLFAHGVTSRLR